MEEKLSKASDKCPFCGGVKSPGSKRCRGCHNSKGKGKWSLAQGKGKWVPEENETQYIQREIEAK